MGWSRKRILQQTYKRMVRQNDILMYSAHDEANQKSLKGLWKY